MDGGLLITPCAGNAGVTKAIDHLVHAIVHRVVTATYRIFRFNSLRYVREKAIQRKNFGNVCGGVTQIDD